jgi:hypothetical protein
VCAYWCPRNKDCSVRTVERVGCQRRQFILPFIIQNVAGVAFNRVDVYFMQVICTQSLALSWMNWGSNPCGGKVFRAVQVGPEAHPATCTMSTASYLGVKRPQRGADHPLRSSVGLRMGWSYTSASLLCQHRYVMGWPWPLYVYTASATSRIEHLLLSISPTVLFPMRPAHVTYHPTKKCRFYHSYN